MGRDLFGIKFSAHLAAHLTPEWRSQYLQYESMVAILYAAVDRAPVIEEINRHRYFLRIDGRFFAYCNKELIKINVFFGEKLSESIRRLDQLRTELNYYKKTLTINRSEQSVVRQRRQTKIVFRSNYNRIDDLKLAFSELYLLLVLLQNYQTLNYMGFKKILTKHDKLFHKTNGIEWLKTNVDLAPFVNNQQVSNLIDEVELLVTDHLENGNRRKAMQKLRVPPLTQIHKSIVTYRLGLLNGLFIILFISLFVIYLRTKTNSQTELNKKPIDWQLAIILYRSSLIFIIHFIFIGINIIGWSTYGINHVLIFELDPRSHVTHEEILEGASFLSLTWIISVLTFILCQHYQLESHWSPLVFIFLIVFLLLNPLNVMHRPARYWFCRQLFRIFSAPCHSVTFADFWLADQLTSLDLIFYDFEYLICYFLITIQWFKMKSNDFSHLNINEEQITFYNAPICQSKQFYVHSFFPLMIKMLLASINFIFRSIIASLPSWFRMAQCLRRYYDTRLTFPHLVNAIKYSCGLVVAICSYFRRKFHLKYNHHLSNPFFYAWIISEILNSGFKFAWDLKMDWGLFDQHAGEYWFLRDELVYPRRVYYYLTIITNFLLRYLWIVKIYLIVHIKSIEYAELVVFIFALAESLRRFMWNFFRLENEHLNNCGQFRAVRDISINPRREHR